MKATSHQSGLLDWVPFDVDKLRKEWPNHPLRTPFIKQQYQPVEALVRHLSKLGMKLTQFYLTSFGKSP